MIEHKDHTTNELEVLEKYVRVCLCRCEWKEQSSGSNATVVCLLIRSHASRLNRLVYVITY